MTWSLDYVALTTPDLLALRSEACADPALDREILQYAIGDRFNEVGLYGLIEQYWGQRFSRLERLQYVLAEQGVPLVLATLVETYAVEPLYVPLPFWFSHTSGNALPLVAFSYRHYHVQISFANLADCVETSP